MCITKTDCVSNFSFITVAHQDDLDNLRNVSGIIGLTPTLKESSRFDLFIDSFKNAGTIDKAMWSFFVDMDSDTSKMTFGGYDKEKFALPGVDMNFHDINTTSEEW